MAVTARHRLFIVGVCLLAASITQASRSVTIDRGWKPALQLTGDGDSTRAITAMRGAAELWKVALQQTDVDSATDDFMKRAVESLKDFDLEGLYELLPDQNGPFRELRVHGARERARYVVGRPARSSFEVAPDGTREAPGDTSLVLRSRGVLASDGDTNYLIQARAGVVVGKISWPMVMAANREWLQLIASTNSPDPSPGARPMVATRMTAKQANPKLGSEDVEVVATLWEAFPRMSYLVSSLGRIDDLIVNDQPANVGGATHVRLMLAIDVSRMNESYPELANYLDDLGKLFSIDLDWVDKQGRTLASLHVESERLQARLELYTKDGLILPFRDRQVFVNEPVDPRRGPLRYSTRVSSNFRMLGMYSHTRGGRMDWSYDPNTRGMELHGRMTKVPTVTVDGAALGILPPGLIDAFIPGDLRSLITEFLTTACNGNEGRGIALTVRFDQRPTTVATIDAKFGIEALNNFLVKVGVGFFNDRVMPDEDVSADVTHLMIDAQGAFSADLERYARAR